MTAQIYELYTLIDGEWLKAYTQLWQTPVHPALPAIPDLLERMTGLKCAVIAEHFMLETGHKAECRLRS